MSISFDNIPTSIRKPGIVTEYNTTLAVQGLPANAQKIALLAQKTSSGIGSDSTSVAVFSENDLVLYGGTGSIAHLSGKAIFDANPNVQMDLVPLDDGAGTDSTGTITITGIDATTAGTIETWVGNVRVESSVAVGDSTDTVASSIQTAISAIEHTMPVTSAVADNVISLYARNYGTLGNNIPVSSKMFANSDSTATIVQPTGGATDPSIATALTNIYPGDYDIIVNTLNNSTALGLLSTHLTDRASPTEDRPAIGVFGYTEVQATIETLCGTTLNAGRMSCGYLKYTKTTERGHSLDYEIAGAYAAVIAGEQDPARPLNGLVLPGIAPCAEESKLSRSQQESLLLNGVTPLENVTGSKVAIVRSISTYTTSASGYADVSLLDLMTIRTLDYTKLAVETRLGLVFPRSKLSQRTPAKVRTQVINVLLQLEEQEILENVEANLDMVIVERNANDPNRIDIKIPADVVNGLHVIAQRIDLKL